MFDKEKFKTLVHYACASVDDPAKLGAVKLNKIAWFSDVFAFAELGRSMTGAVYVKEKFGPIPRAMLPMVRELEEEGRIRVEEVAYFGKTKKQYVNLGKPDMGAFSEQELQIADYVIREITDGYSAASISDLTHDDVWKIAEIGEQIPMQAVLASDLKIVSEADREWVRNQNNAREAA